MSLKPPPPPRQPQAGFLSLDMSLHFLKFNTNGIEQWVLLSVCHLAPDIMVLEVHGGGRVY